MIRRGGRFYGPPNHHVPPLPEDVGAVLQEKWLGWIHQESFNRLVYRAFISDSQASITLSTNPLISFAELKAPMPTSAYLWHARSAEEWKSLYLEIPQRSTPLSLVEYLSDPVELQGCYDVHFCQLIILCGVWGMFWHYHQLRVALGKCRDTNAGLSLHHQKILQILEQFRINAPEEEELPARAEITLLFELLYMHLHMPFQEVELFAGKRTLDDARRALPQLRAWLDNEDSRQAVWHAGQVLRAAETFRPMHLRGFFAIAVYQAALTIWVYSIAPQIKGTDPSLFDNPDNLASLSICLNGPDLPAIQRFINRGKPGLCVIQPRGGGSYPDMTPAIPLSDHEAVVNVVQEILSDNFRGCEAPPPLVENLTLLLHNLGRAATNIKT